MARPAHRCDECGKRRVGVTVVENRDLCPACAKALEPVKTEAERKLDVVRWNADQLRQQEAAVAEMIGEARDAGASLRAIADAAGMSQEGVRQLLKRTAA